MPRPRLHKLVFAATSEQLWKLLRDEAEQGWRPCPFEPQRTQGGLLLVLEKRAGHPRGQPR